MLSTPWREGSEDQKEGGNDPVPGFFSLFVCFSSNLCMCLFLSLSLSLSHTHLQTTSHLFEEAYCALGAEKICLPGLHVGTGVFNDSVHQLAQQDIKSR